jgi:hypothetical protein
MEIIGVVFFCVIVWIIWSIYKKTRNENISKERKEDEPEEWQKEFSDMQNVINEKMRKEEEAKQLNISESNHIRNQFCPDIEKVLMAFAKSTNGNYEQSGNACLYRIKYNNGTTFTIVLHFDQMQLRISSDYPGYDKESYCLDLKDFSDVKFANELKNFFLRIYG